MLDDPLRYVRIGITLVGLVPLILFIYRYRRYSPWRANVLGRSLMIQKENMLALFAFITISLLLTDFPGRELVGALLYLFLVGTFWNDYIQLLRIQRQHHRANARDRRLFDKQHEPR